MMRFSPFNPIRFYKSGAPAGHGEHVRTFAVSDCVMLEVFLGSGEEAAPLVLVDMESDEEIADIPLKEYRVNGDERMELLEMSNLSPGHYAMRLAGYASECFDVVDDDEAEGTVLIQYAYRDNTRRDDVLNRIFGGIRYFSLRIPGGFRDSGWIFGVECERFETQSSDPVVLAAMDITDRMLTIGSSAGVDAWTAELVNRVLTCPLVFIDGIRYARSDGASLSREGSEPDKAASVYSVLLREARYLNAEMELAVRLNLRRTPDRIRRAGQRPRRYL